MATFTYSELGVDSVRLLKIHYPESCNTKPRLELVHVLDTDLKSTRYEAVSYVWGSSERHHIVEFVNGNLFNVTATLHQALPHLMTASTTGMLWIDQLCIDQSNNGEKSHQVRKMGLIYTHAKRTLAWLGFLPEAHSQFTTLIPSIHKELDTWIKIHGEDPLLECPDDSASDVSAFTILAQIIHHRRTSKKSDWNDMFDAISSLGFESKMGNWDTGTRSEKVGGYLWRLYQMNGSTKDYSLETGESDDGSHEDLILDQKAENTRMEDLEISKREDALIFYCYRAVLKISQALSKGKSKGLTASLDTVLETLRPLLEHTLGHPWCTRVWIMQEVKLSKKVRLLMEDKILKPRKFLRLNELLRFCRGALGKTMSKDKALHQAKWASLFAESHDYKDPLSTYLIRRLADAEVANEKATDPRDLIYGLLPVCRTEPHLPATNYSLNVSQVFAAATRYFVARHDSLWVLQFCTAYRSSQTTDQEESESMILPSWVTDWSGPSLMQPLSTTFFPCIFSGVPRCSHNNDGRFYSCPNCGDGGIAYRAAGQRKHLVVQDESWEVLTVRGKVIDHVIDLVMEPDDPEWKRDLIGMFSSVTSEKGFQSRFDEGLAAIIERATRLEDGTTPLRRRDLLEFLFINPYLYRPYAFRTHGVSMEDVLHHAEQDDAAHVEFLQPQRVRNYFSLLLGRDFALTRNGFYLGPDTMQIGDEIAIIHGSEFPLVLRPVDKDEQTYEFVGQCMVRDKEIMFGGAVDWEEMDAQTFRLV